jgi:hypothetical protein
MYDNIDFLSGNQMLLFFMKDAAIDNIGEF